MIKIDGFDEVIVDPDSGKRAITNDTLEKMRLLMIEGTTDAIMKERIRSL